MRHALPFLPTPPSLPASLSVAPCASPAIADDGDPFGSLSAYNHDHPSIDYHRCSMLIIRSYKPFTAVRSEANAFIDRVEKTTLTLLLRE
jgi:hypothetical protein